MTINALARALPRAFSALALAAVAGCATTGGVDHQDRHTAGPKDPYETVNRKMFAFNDTVDEYALKPVAKAYNAVIPSPVRTGIHNFFGNFADAWSAVNQLLQGKPGDAGTMTLRVLTNTTIGIAGIFDPATSLGFERKPEDLGLTLGHWGVEPGPYLVLPLFGPSDIRDAVALPADTYVTPALLVPKFWQGVAVDAVGVVDTRAGLLGASQMLDDLAFDRYTFMRDAYITRRRSLVYDGNPPDLPDYDDQPDDSKSAPAPAGAASGADLADDRQNHVFWADPGAETAIDIDQHILGRGLDQCLGRQHMLDLRGADAVCQRAEGAMGRSVAVAAHDRGARQRKALLGADDMDDALAAIELVVIFDAEFLDVLRQHGDLLGAFGIGIGLGAIGCRHVVVDHRERLFGGADLSPRRAQAFKGLRRGHFVHQMAVDIDQAGAVLGLVHQMIVPDLVV